MLATESAALLQNLVSLTERVSQLGTRLSQAASAVQSTGILPPKTLIDEITASRHSFSELSAKGIALAETLAISPPPKADTIVSLADLKALLQTLTQAEEKRKIAQELSQRALATLDRLYAIKHRDREVFAPLAECQMRGTVLRNAIAETPWPKVHPSVEELARDDNPFVALLTLVEHGERLEDEYCMRLQEIVEQAFSRSLAIAALRQKLTLLSNVELIEESRAGNAAASSTITDNSGSNGTKRSGADPSRSNGSAAGVKIESEKQPATFTDGRTGTNSKNLKSESPRNNDLPRSVFEASGERKLAAVDMQAGARGTKGELLPPGDSVLSRVTTEGGERHGEMFSLVLTASPVSSAISESVADGSVPTEVPSATTTAVVQERSNTTGTRGTGGIDVFYRFEVEDKAQKIASMLLTGAYGVVEEKPAFLRDLIWRLIFEEKLGLAFHVARCLEVQHPDFYPRLPSWLLRTVILGQRVRNPQGEIARILKEDFARCEKDCRTTGDKEWDLAVEFLLLAGSFLPALLAPETRASTVLHGVCLGNGLENLSAYCNVFALYGDLLMPLDPTALKKSARLQAKESVGFMRRLIGNQEAGGRKDVVSEQAEPLRIEIGNRQQTVIEELNLFKAEHSSITLLGSLACCRRAVENVAILFDPESPFSADEPLPRPLLNIDLSRIPTLVLNKQGEVEGVDQPTFLESVLRLVTSGSLKML